MPGNSNKMDRYDATTRTWKVAPPMQTARYYAATATLDDKLYMIAGGPEGKSVEVFDGTQWQAGVPLPDYRMHHCAVTVKSRKIFVIGGFDWTNALSGIMSFTSGASAWDQDAMTSPPLLQARHGHACAGESDRFLYCHCVENRVVGSGGGMRPTGSLC